jgi:hypothetical protein
MEIARLPERYHKEARSLVRRAYFKLLGNRQLVDPIFNDLIKVAWRMLLSGKNMKTLEQSVSTIEENYKAFVSAASRFNNNFIYQYPVQYHAEIPVEISERRRVEHHIQRPTVHHCNHRSRNQREPNNNDRSRGYEHHYAFMATTVDPNMDDLGEDDKSVHSSRALVQTPGKNQKFFTMESKEELYEKNKKFPTVLQKLDNIL